MPEETIGKLLPNYLKVLAAMRQNSRTLLQISIDESNNA
jgi:hypothetical protein